MEQRRERLYVGRTADFDDDRRRKITINGHDVVVLSWRGTFHAFENRCGHQGGPVGEGVIIGCVKGVLDEQKRYLGERFDDDEPHLVCPWHGWEYELQTGRFVGDRRRAIRRYEVSVEEDEVYVQL